MLMVLSVAAPLAQLGRTRRGKRADMIGRAMTAP
jgi:hypothetical protein